MNQEFESNVKLMSLYVTPVGTDKPFTLFKIDDALSFDLNATVAGTNWQDDITVEFVFELMEPKMIFFQATHLIPFEVMDANRISEGDNDIIASNDIFGTMRFDAKQLPDFGTVQITASVNNDSLSTRFAFAQGGIIENVSDQ